MVHIIITAGGTTEAIDGVRQIGNTSTGNLGASIYEALAEDIATKKKTGKHVPEFFIHYVVSSTAVRPEPKDSLPVSFYEVTDVKSVAVVIERLMADYKTDYAVHSMAVSDFTKGYLVERGDLAEELAEAIEQNTKDGRLLPQELRKLIEKMIECPKRALDSSAKISSKSDLILSLNRTPKIIEKFKKLNPEIFLVGFKLLRGVSKEELIRAAEELAEKRGCDLVLANDMNSIKNGRHEGLLLEGSLIVGRYGTKKERAAGIVRHMLDKTQR